MIQIEDTEDNNLDYSNIASPTYEGVVKFVRVGQCGFIHNHNVTRFEGKDIYFSSKVLKSGIVKGDKVRFSIAMSDEKIWAYDVVKVDDSDDEENVEGVLV